MTVHFLHRKVLRELLVTGKWLGWVARVLQWIQLQYQRHEVLGKGYVDMSMESLCSPKSTHHQGSSQHLGRQCDSSHEHQLGLLSRTQVPGSSVRILGNLRLPLSLVALGSSDQDSSRQRAEPLCWRVVQTQPAHRRHPHPCPPLSHRPGLSRGAGEALNQIWLKYTSRSRLTYLWKSLCLNYN